MEQNEGQNVGRLMEYMTVKDVRETLQESKTILIPLGVVEQHGYHLPLSTDIHNAYEISRRVSERTGVMVAPPFSYSFSGGALPGTINITPQVMSLVVMDICRSLVSQGFRNLIFVLGHGGTENKNALDDCVTLFLRQNPELKDEVVVALAPVWEFSETWLKEFQNKDFHAALVETSLMMYWKPELVREEVEVDKDEVVQQLRTDPDNYLEVEKTVDDPHVVPYKHQRDEIEVGVMGDPTGANKELGEKICDEVVEGVVKLIGKIGAK